VNPESETDMTVADVLHKGLVMKTIFGHLKANRIEYAVFTLLLYSIGALDKATTYVTGMCV
jgi:hypothetical protein